MLILILVLFLSLNAHANTPKQYITAIEQKNWHVASQTSNKDLRALTTWLKLILEKNPSCSELISFVKQHPHWPRQSYLKQKIEEASDCENSNILAWFKDNSPQITKGKKKYLELIQDPTLKKQYAKLIWQEASFSRNEEIEFLKKYRHLLKQEDHLKRINHLLYNHNGEQAARVIPLIPVELRKPYQLRLNLHYKKTVILDNHLKADVGVLHNLAHIHEGNKDDDNLIQTLSLSSTLDQSVQAYFWRLKVKMIRLSIQRGKYKTAYLFASSHGHADLKEYSEAEWLAGWIALRFLNSPKTAITHFDNFYHKVQKPISLARGAYWLGRSYEKLNDKPQSRNWYNIAAKYYTSFYGQLSICKINKCQLQLPSEAAHKHEDLQKFNNNQLVKAALVLAESKYNHLSKELLLRAIDHSDHPGEIALIAKINLKDNHYHLSTELAKAASYKNIIILKNSYPMPQFIYNKHNIEHALVLSLIRQESVFNHQAISSAGAMGLMQIMPHVAKKTAADIKVKYHKEKLLSDPHFNTRLGSCHIESLLQEYNNSYILSIAAYNAGSKAVNKWIEDNGDPRLMKNEEDIIDWMEKITFYETRNYVQRVLENRSIYYLIINRQNKLPKILS